MSPKYCVLFAGQSVQAQGMCRELWRIPAARDILERLKPSLGDDLEHITTEMPGPELAKTFNAQRAIHAHHLGNWFAYKAAHPELELCGAVGHSMGVVAALVAAGALSVEDSGLFIRARAQAFSDVCRTFAEPQGMAAVITKKLGEFKDRIAAFPGVSLALHNTLGKGTIGGKLADIEAFAAHVKKEGWPMKVLVLKVEGPYHTAAFTPCKPALQAAVEKIALRPPQIPVFMGTSGRAESDPARIRSLLVEQADHLERHFDAVRAAFDGGCRDFIEVGYKPQPIAWLSDQLVGEDGKALAGVAALAVKTEALGEKVE
ncbi:MAG: acyltransferase domain-containing protein [Elusimicrobia bacterium]|nr:acyltransferase domain-containing protein [Elusimicrobiota bacterium]